jgi:hypothetical protein
MPARHHRVQVWEPLRQLCSFGRAERRQ